MKRKVFQISINGFIVGERYAWNTARRAVRKYVEQDLKADERSSSVQETNYIRDECNQFTAGTEEWRTDAGRSQVVTITRMNQ